MTDRDTEQMKALAEKRLGFAVCCDLGPDDRPCDECLTGRQLAEDVLALAARMDAEKQRADALAKTLVRAAKVILNLSLFDPGSDP